MKILHFCSYYVGSKVYQGMFSALETKEIGFQQVFVPIRNNNHLGNNKINCDTIKFNYVKCLSVFTRIFYFYKLIRVFFSTCMQLGFSNKFDVLHAHTLYGDGISAFLFARLCNKKLVITLRNTDVNLGFKFYWHYKWLAKLALRYADDILFVSPAHQITFESYFGSEFSNKLLFIPNGIADIFIQSALKNKKVIVSNPHAIYVGGINRNKNIHNAIKAFSLVNRGTDWCFTIVGGSCSDFIECYGALDEKVKARVRFISKVSHNELIQYYDSATIFIMPSHTETFGLVYLEAISRCLPIVYTFGQGIDGVFDDGDMGFGCNSHDISSISEAIKKTQAKYPNGLEYITSNSAVAFSWDCIAERYVTEVYM